MKNLHLLPTDNKSSKLYFNVNDKEFQICEIEKTSTILKPNRHIYITSDEEIKEGDWYLELNEIHKFKLGCFTDINSKKIILTTNQDLIKDGVQAIPDEFLEWFVKNPSCEEVEIGNQSIQSFDTGHFEDFYKIIIQKEESKQHLVDMKNHEDSLWEDEPKQDEIMERFIANAKQETTLEEVIGIKSHNYSMQYVGTDKYTVSMLAIEFGYHLALEQQERSYSEEEVGEILYKAFGECGKHYSIMLDGAFIDRLFKQFKKK
jgi:hypothetical protein